MTPQPRRREFIHSNNGRFPLLAADCTADGGTTSQPPSATFESEMKLNAEDKQVLMEYVKRDPLLLNVSEDRL